MAKREQLDLGGALPGALGLRKEAAGFPESLADVRREAQVREILDDFNRRVLADRLRPAVGRLPPAIARTVDVDDLVGQWSQLRERITAEARARAEAMEQARAAEEESKRAARRDRSWWRALRRRR